MRMSVDEKAAGVTYKVTLDGEEVSNKCFAFDTEEGWADCFVLNESGQLVIGTVGDSHSWEDYEVARERLYGNVFAIKEMLSDG